MFPLRYCLAQQGHEFCPPLGFPPAAFTAFIGTIRLSDCPHSVCFPPLRLYGIPAVSSAGECWISHVDALSLYSMIGSPTPPQHPKSRHNDKLVFCLPPTQQRRPAGMLFISVLNGYPTALLSTLRLYCCQHNPKTRFRWRGYCLTGRDFHPHGNAPLFRGALCDKL